MLRFCENERISQQDYESALTREPLCFSDHIWKDGRERFRYFRHNDFEPFLIPVADERGEIICFAYQDNEANRELRMLKELRKNKAALQFVDVFPQYKEVVICGCNELAAAFAEYLRELGVAVTVMGEYWDCIGYQSDWQIELARKRNTLVLYAEGLASLDFNPDKWIKRSVSPEFECIDKIYEENVLTGKICDILGNSDDLFRKLKEKREIVIMGITRQAQDVYDLLMAHGIDIFGFVLNKAGQKEILGKRILDVTDAMRELENPVFLNCESRYGALGDVWTEYFDYRGYERNENYFLIQDYVTDIPISNLVHVLHKKRVLLTGDPRLCELLADYLNQIEQGEVCVRYTALGQTVSTEPGDIRCLVALDYKHRKKGLGEIRDRALKKALSDMNFTDHSRYFKNLDSLVLVDLYLNRGMAKYSEPELTPKGILLGQIPPATGNVFFRGILDGHPEILQIYYSDLNENLFYYCVRLANIDSNEVLDRFWKMYDEEAQTKETYFTDLELFEKSMRRLLGLRKSFTSQELFVLFQVAYAEMKRGEQIQNISKLVLYWEPHIIQRSFFPFFALWLEDEKIHGQTIFLCRDNIVRTGSICRRQIEGWRGNPYVEMFRDDSCGNDMAHVQHHHWTTFKMRFEDLKLHPREKIHEVCERLGIAWSDTMLHTTKDGKQPLAYRGSVDFDLKAVFGRQEDFLSEFDRFRISIVSSLYQKRFGYSYESCLIFSRRELQEMFLKPFLFEERPEFASIMVNHTENTERYAWQLWNVRKRMIINDIRPEFGNIELT